MFFIFSFISCQKSEDKIIETLPLPPTNLKVTGYTAVQVDLEWTDVATNEKGYKIQRKQGNSTYSDINSVGSDITNFIDKTVQPNTSYSYRIYSFNSAGQSVTYSNEVTILTMTFDLNSGLIVNFPFAGNTFDISGNNINGSINGSVVLTTDRKSNTNNSYLFSNGKIIFYTPPVWSIKTELTIACWINLSSPVGGGNGACILCNPSIRQTSFSDNGFNFIVFNNTLQASMTSDSQSGGGGGVVKQTGSSLISSKWYHVAYTFDKTGLSTLYLDGIKISSNNGKSINDKDYDKWYSIGNNDFNEAPLNGKIDDLRLYNRALNAYEISVLSKQ
jgi:hypothetical protein